MQGTPSGYERVARAHVGGCARVVHMDTRARRDTIAAVRHVTRTANPLWYGRAEGTSAGCLGLDHVRRVRSTKQPLWSDAKATQGGRVA